MSVELYLYDPAKGDTAAAGVSSLNPLPVTVTAPLANTWSQVHTPAVNVAATKSQAAGATGVKNVCTAITVTLANDATGTVQTLIQFNLRDGATGAGTILWSATMALPATPGECRVLTLSGLWLTGTAATAMTLESSAAPAAHTAASVAFSGVTHS